MKSTITALMCCISLMALSQFGRGSEWHKDHMSQKAKINNSIMWKTAGLTMMSAGIYIGRHNPPQRIDIPMIGFGVIITIEGIRLRKEAGGKRKETIF